MKLSCSRSLFVTCLCSSLGACNLSMPDLQQGENVTASWQSPANYARSPDGINPVNPITLSVDFSDQTGCPNQTYRFWLFSKDGGTPLTGIGSNASLFYTKHFEQTISLPLDAPVYQIRLSCTRANGQRYSDSDLLESGDPAFIPRVAIAWQNPNDYARTPGGTTPVNPITLSANFTDESGCPYKMYRFWTFDHNGSPVGGIGSIMSLQQDGGFGISMTESLPTGTPIYAVRLACVDTDGNLYVSGSNLEAGNPAFTPQAQSGVCSGQNATLCTTPSTSNVCTTCGGTWGAEAGCSNYNAYHCTPPHTSGDCSTCGGTWESESCINYNSSYCSSPTTEVVCQQCLGIWSSTTGCRGDLSSFCSWLATDGPPQTYCESQPTYCTWSGTNCYSSESQNCSSILTQLDCDITNGGTGIGPWGCIWVDANCIGSNTSMCTSPTDESTCTACGGTWATQ